MIQPKLYLDDDQIRRVLEYVDSRAYDYRTCTDRAMVRTLLYSGLRAHDLCALDKGDTPYHHGQDVMVVRNGKGHKPGSVKGPRTVSVPIAPELGQLLTEYVTTWRDWTHDTPRTTPVFVQRAGQRMSYRTVYTRCVQIGQALGFADPLAPHRFRHACGRLAYIHSGHDLYVVRDVLRHANTKTSEVYADICDDRAARVAGSMYQ